MACFDFVQLVFHFCGEPDLEEFRQTCHQIIVDLESEFRRNQFAFFLQDIQTFLNRIDDCGIGGRASDPVQLKFLDQRDFGIRAGVP